MIISTIQLTSKVHPVDLLVIVWFGLRSLTLKGGHAYFPTKSEKTSYLGSYTPIDDNLLMFLTKFYLIITFDKYY